MSDYQPKSMSEVSLLASLRDEFENKYAELLVGIRKEAREAALREASVACMTDVPSRMRVVSSWEISARAELLTDACKRILALIDKPETK